MESKSYIDENTGEIFLRDSYYPFKGTKEWVVTNDSVTIHIAGKPKKSKTFLLSEIELAGWDDNPGITGSKTEDGDSKHYISFVGKIGRKTIAGGIIFRGSDIEIARKVFDRLDSRKRNFKKEIQPYIERLRNDAERAGRGEAISQDEERLRQNDAIRDYLGRYPDELERYGDDVGGWIIDTDDRFLRERKGLRTSEEFINVCDENTELLEREVFTLDEIATMGKMRKRDDLTGLKRFTEIGKQRETGWGTVQEAKKEFIAKHGMTPEEAEQTAWAKFREEQQQG